MLSRKPVSSLITKAIGIIWAVISLVGLPGSIGTAVADGASVAKETISAATMSVGSTTYLRAGPGTNYRAIDEALSGFDVDVVGCGNGWCQVWYGDAPGFLAEAALVARDQTGIALRNPSCFINMQSSYHGNRPNQLCYSNPPAAQTEQTMGSAK